MELTLHTADGLTLEAALTEPAGGAPETTVVICHPHPSYGGTMWLPLLHSLARECAGRGMAALRFNFRGVGASQGGYGEGEAEITDVAAAVAAARARTRLVGLAGWSFGAAVAARWLAAEAETLPFVALAPAIMAPGVPSPRGPHLVIVGNHDQFVPLEAAEAWGGNVLAVPGCDHFFPGSFTNTAAAAAADFLEEHLRRRAPRPRGCSGSG